MLNKNQIKIQTPTGKNRWCGPAALSILTGMTTDDASRLVRSITLKSKCTGMHWNEMLVALMQCGFQCVRRPHRYKGNNRITLSRWVKENKSNLSLQRTGGYKTYLISAGYHFQIIQGPMYVDNHVKEPVFFDEIKKGKRRIVRRVYQLYADNIIIPDHAYSWKNR